MYSYTMWQSHPVCSISCHVQLYHVGVTPSMQYLLSCTVIAYRSYTQYAVSLVMYSYTMWESKPVCSICHVQLHMFVSAAWHRSTEVIFRKFPNLLSYFNYYYFSSKQKYFVYKYMLFVMRVRPMFAYECLLYCSRRER